MADAAAQPARRIFFVTPTFEGALGAELTSAWRARAVIEWPGIVSADEPVGNAKCDVGVERPRLDPVFARQQMPEAREIRAPGIAGLASACYAAIEPAIDRARGPFTIHPIVPTGADPRLANRCDLVAQETLALLRQRRKRAARLFRPVDDTFHAFDEVSAVVQILLIERDRGFVSVATPLPLIAGGWDIVPWPGGLAPVAEDRHPPSRAYRKLEEAFVWMADQPAPGELCVDLGAAPGGWTYGALARGARVIAIDRAPLAPPVRDHPALTAITGNAFTYQPPARADWLLSDIVCEPTRALALIARWMDEDLCRKLVVTVKFKGRGGYGVLDGLCALFARSAWPRFRVKHLHHNKNEVTVMASSSTSVTNPLVARDAGQSPRT